MTSMNYSWETDALFMTLFLPDRCCHHRGKKCQRTPETQQRRVSETRPEPQWRNAVTPKEQGVQILNIQISFCLVCRIKNKLWKALDTFGNLLCYFRGSSFSQCFILSTALHCLLPSKFYANMYFEYLPIVSSAFKQRHILFYMKQGG